MTRITIEAQDAPVLVTMDAAKAAYITVYSEDNNPDPLQAAKDLDSGLVKRGQFVPCHDWKANDFHKYIRNCIDTSVVTGDHKIRFAVMDNRFKFYILDKVFPTHSAMNLETVEVTYDSKNLKQSESESEIEKQKKEIKELLEDFRRLNNLKEKHEAEIKEWKRLSGELIRQGQSMASELECHIGNDMLVRKWDELISVYRNFKNGDFK